LGHPLSNHFNYSAGLSVQDLSYDLINLLAVSPPLYLGHNGAHDLPEVIDACSAHLGYSPFHNAHNLFI